MCVEESRCTGAPGALAVVAPAIWCCLQRDSVPPPFTRPVWVLPFLLPILVHVFQPKFRGHCLSRRISEIWEARREARRDFLRGFDICKRRGRDTQAPCEDRYNFMPLCCGPSRKTTVERARRDSTASMALSRRARFACSSRITRTTLRRSSIFGRGLALGF